VSKHYCAYAVFVLLCGLGAYPQQPKENKKQLFPGTPVKSSVDKDPALTTANIAGQRDLSKYDDGGPFDCRRHGKELV
jgi:hypothetical protein